MKYKIFSLRSALWRLLSVFAVMSAAMAVTACGDDDEVLDTGGPTVEPPAPTTTRTVLVYMVANNSLGTSYHCDEADFQEMLTAAASEEGFHGGRLLVYHNPPRCSESNPCQLIEVTATGLKVLKEYAFAEEGESVTSERMQEVVADMKAWAPADDYGMVFWSHADNWLGNNNSTDHRYRGFGQDGNYRMSVPTLARTLEGERFAFLYFDCCLMGNVEPLYELRELAPLAVASPTELGIDGMPYQKNAPLMFDPTLSDEERCCKMAENTYNYYQNHESECTGSNSCVGGTECQMTVVRLDNLDALAAATRDIMATLETLPYTLSAVQSYSGGWSNWGAYDMDALMESITPDDSPELLEAWREELARTIVYSPYTTRGIGDLYLRRYCGLGAYGMTKVSDQTWRSYNTLQWWADVVSTAPVFKVQEAQD